MGSLRMVKLFQRSGVKILFSHSPMARRGEMVGKLNSTPSLTNAIIFNPFSSNMNFSTFKRLYEEGLKFDQQSRKERRYKTKCKEEKPDKSERQSLIKTTFNQSSEGEEEAVEKPKYEGDPKEDPTKSTLQSNKRRSLNRAHKSHVRTLVKKVREALDDLVTKPNVQREIVVDIEKKVAEAYSVIDKAVQVGSLHRNNGARRKYRLAVRMKAVEIHCGLYKPASSTNLTA